MRLNLAHIDRTIGKEPQYQSSPKYALAVFGPEAAFKVWLVLDGEVLYADKNGDGDLTDASERFCREKDEHGRPVFNVGDITLGGQLYARLEVRTAIKLRDQAAAYGCLPDFQTLIAADPEAPGYALSIDVPLSRPFHDEKGRRVTSVRHYVNFADANGILQFGNSSAQAPLFHFGGPWAVWPREGQKFVLGRAEEFTALIGTPGYGPGTLAVIQHSIVSARAQPVLDAEFRDKNGRVVAARLVLEGRC
jgi:hypothetical protein